MASHHPLAGADALRHSWRYCGAVGSLLPAYDGKAGGFAPCFVLTVFPLTAFCALLVLGFLSLGCCRVQRWHRRGQVAGAGARKGSWVGSAQLMLTVLGMCVPLAHVAACTLYDGFATEYVIVSDSVACLGWIAFSVFQGRLRRKHAHPLSWSTLPTRLFLLTNLTQLILTALSHRSPAWWFVLHPGRGRWRLANLVLFGVHSVVITGLLAIELAGVVSALTSPRRRGYTSLQASDEEDGGEAGNAGQGGARGSSSINGKATQPLGTVEQQEGSVWTGLYAKVAKVWPFVWPVGQHVLQLRVLLCFGLLGAGRAVNLFVPLYYKKVVDALTGDPGTHLDFPVRLIWIYVAFRFLQGGGTGSMGFLNNMRTFLWIKVRQYTERAIRVRLFSHLHALSLRWHLSRKTGEVLRMMDRGTNSINSLLNSVIFSILPTLVDIAIAIVYFTTSFGPYFGLIVFVTMASYIAFTIVTTEWRTKFRRDMNSRDNKIRQKAVDSLLNFETVKYYSGEEFETTRFHDTIVDYQIYDWISSASLNLLNSGQTVIITIGLAAGTLLCGFMVVEGRLTVGDFVLYIAYVVQLYAPLNWFGTYYRMIQQNFIDMENLLSLLDVEQEVVDSADAKPLQHLDDGRCSISFRDVHFAYEPRKPILKGISFDVEPGQTVAIVGQTGSGKSTIMRLLYRFYDLQQGSILVNGQDVSKTTIQSLRNVMGVVPQDTVLFHDTIEYNIMYGNMEASSAEVKEAAKGAEIYNQITTFPDKFDTVVGERGLKLSGGEKQRVAIARTILKRPQIVLLDEATSALDTETERNIQASLNRICKGRTTISIAHRLSTIVGADLILVLMEGEIVERGTHTDLLSKGGQYAAMWQQQLQAAGKDTEAEGDTSTSVDDKPSSEA